MLYKYVKSAMTMKISLGFDFILDDKNRIDNDILQP
jgi:hypothetical protein